MSVKIATVAQAILRAILLAILISVPTVILVFTLFSKTIDNFSGMFMP